ncbi:MAG: hypothetical protein J6A90_01960 [Clostridia bacterium]|nr:hypothetical protein [Clostridia bacterium]
MAKQKYDFSEYEMSHTEKRSSTLRGNQSVSYDFFFNDVSFDPDERTFVITVDSGNEDFTMQEAIDQYNEDEAKRREIHEDILSEEEIQQREESRLRDLEYNAEVLARMNSKYIISKDLIDNEENNYYIDNPQIKRIPLNNVLSGARIKMRYGEGILDFVYADFKTPAIEAMKFYNFMNALGNFIGEQSGKTKPTEEEIQARAPEKVYNRNQLIVEDYFRYQDTMSNIKQVAYASLYTTVCPPLFKEFRTSAKALKSYCNVLLMLQKEYLDMIEFCFDENYYPEVLGHLAPSERWFVFKRLHNLSSVSYRKESLTFSTMKLSGNVMPYGLPPTEVAHRINTKIDKTEHHIAFEEKYNITHKELEPYLRFPHFISFKYEFRTVADILELEFTKMLEQDIRFKKCKRCGRYFIMKGNYDTNYCDRVAEGQTRTCQDLAAQENYKAKAAENPALAIYSKYYKRYAARVRSRQIKESDFKKWKFQALSKRDECSDGKITVEEYIAWMEGYFPNRTPKT